MKRESVGSVGVDSGIIYIGPCDLTDVGGTHYKDWSVGITVSTFGGYGECPVYVERSKDGIVRRVIIDFNPPLSFLLRLSIWLDHFKRRWFA